MPLRPKTTAYEEIRVIDVWKAAMKMKTCATVLTHEERRAGEDDFWYRHKRCLMTTLCRHPCSPPVPITLCHSLVSPCLVSPSLFVSSRGPWLVHSSKPLIPVCYRLVRMAQRLSDERPGLIPSGCDGPLRFVPPFPRPSLPCRRPRRPSMACGARSERGGGGPDPGGRRARGGGRLGGEGAE